MKKERQIKKGFLAALILLFAVGVKAQYWVPLNFQPDKIPIATYSDSKYFYTCYDGGYNKKGKTINVAKWDGLVWQRATPLVLDSNARVHSLCVFKGEIYLGGDFHLPFQVSVQNIVKLNDSRWSALNSGASFSNRSNAVYTMTSNENGLYIGGNFDTINKVSYKNLAYYDGTKIDKLSDFGADGIISELKFVNDELHAVGSFSEIGTVKTKGVAFYKNKEWFPLGNVVTLHTRQISQFQGSQFVAVSNGGSFFFYKYKSGIDWTKHMNGLFSCKEVKDIINYNNKIYACGKFFFSGKDSVNLVTWNGTIWEKVAQNIYACDEFRIYKDKLHASGNIARTQNTTRPIFTARFEPNLVQLRGLVYWDLDEDCITSKGDNFLPKERIKLMPSNRYLYSNDKGYFSALVDKTVTYTVEIEPRRHWKSSSCGASIVKFDFKTDGEGFIQFPLTLEANKKDIRVDLSSGSGWVAAKGERQFYRINYKNLGSVSQDGVITLKFDERLRDFEAYPAPSIYNPGSVSWRFKDLGIDEQNEIGFYLRIDDFDIKDKENLDFLVSATIAEDENNDDNFDSLKQEVSSENTSSIFKAMYPEPDYGDTISNIPSSSEFVEFIIHFENPNDVPVRTVHIIDTIDLSLSLAHIQELGASHNYTTQVLNDPLNPNKGILIWTFKDINLGKFDSEGGFENPTFGYISFEMKLKTNAIGTVFSNQAKVIYDYSNEYLTNRVWGKIIDETIGINDIHYDDSRLAIFPNPVEDFTKITLDDGFSSVQVLNEMGQEVFYQDLEISVFHYDLPLSSLPVGAYFLLVKNDSNVFVKKILKK